MLVREPYPRRINEFLAYNGRESREYCEERSRCAQFAAEHEFAIKARGCFDGRMSNLPKTLGLRRGDLIYRRSAGGRIAWDNLHVMRELTEGRRKAGRGEKPIIYPLTVHYSGSHPQHSCAAFKNETARATAEAQQNVARLVDCLPGIVVPLVLLQDTDVDDVTLVGTDGQKLCTSSFLDLADDKRALREELERRLRDLYDPMQEKALLLLPRSSLREAFHHELTERLVANVEFVAEVTRAGRPIELRDHCERFIGIGNAFWWVHEHNRLFVIDHRESDWLEGFKLALSYLLRQSVLDAAEARDDEWVAPILIGCHYELPEDRAIMAEHTLALAQTVSEHLPQAIIRAVGSLTSFIKSGARKEYGEWIAAQLARAEPHVAILPTVSSETTLLMEPLTS